MVIAGLVVQVHPERETDALAALVQVAGARLEGLPAIGQAVVLLEAGNDAAADARMQEIQAIPGVLGVYPAYIHSEV